jgi:hypothetical protein
MGDPDGDHCDEAADLDQAEGHSGAATTSPTTITQPTRKPAQTLGAGLLGGRAEEDVNAQP